MKQRWMLAMMAVAMIALWSSSAIAQNFAKVYGVCKDAEGNPLVGATVRYVSQDTGQNWELKTNKKGEYMSIGIAPGHKYNVILIGSDGKEVDHVNDSLGCHD